MGIVDHDKGSPLSSSVLEIIDVKEVYTFINTFIKSAQWFLDTSPWLIVDDLRHIFLRSIELVVAHFGPVKICMTSIAHVS